LPFRFSNQNFVCISHLSHPCYMPCPSHAPWFDHTNIIWWSVHVMKLLIFRLLQPSNTFSLDPNIFLSTLFSNTLSLCSSHSVRDPVLHPYKTTVKLWLWLL
jgi:hypothetical protein